MKTWAVLSLFASLALAQSSSYGAATPSASADPMVPTGLSTECQTFIDSFNKDDSLTTCTKSLISATQNFGPGGSAGSTPTTAEVTSAVNNICTGSASTACPDSLIRGKLGDFYAACSKELTSDPNNKLREIYDVLYALTPLKQAICSKSDSGDYCVLGSAKSVSSGVDLNKVQEALSYAPTDGSSYARRAEAVVAANLTTFHDNNLPFLLISGSLDTSALCTPCTRNILTSYFNYESDVPYAPGLTNSKLLSGQNALVGNIQEKCGANFLNGAVQAAGGIKSGTLGSNAAPEVNSRFASVTAVVAGGLTLAIATLL
ncbi:hypothetical protein D9756_007961 [Leucocoprinus leucothites]|uniref:Uncharacterized protein n=1 Tax=Leucocoprinus leucothites TaxID=201217 RepID=A0A8H5FYD5_9AGAR|nr:hypothetical protein D9756_007961 [Leucoagaricus leucothites]